MTPVDSIRFRSRVCAAGVLALLLTCWSGALIAQPAVEVQSAPQGQQSAPVIVDGRVLFQVRGVTAYPAVQRAEEVRLRIVSLAEDESFNGSELTIVETEERSEIRRGEFVVLPVYDVDAALENLPRALLAKVYLEKIAFTIDEYRADRSTNVLARNTGYAAGATVLLALVVWGVRALFRALIGWTERHVRRGVEELASKSHYLIRPGPLWSLATGAMRLLRTLVYLVLAYTYLNTVLGLYPWSRPVARILFELVLDPLRALGSGTLAALPNLAFLVVLYLAVRYLLKVIRAFFRGVEYGRIQLENFDPDWAEPTFKILRVAIVAFALVIAYPYIPGSDSLAFKGVSVFVGVLLSLGSSSYISNMIAGLSMTYRGAFKVGDRIKVGEVVGTVENVKLMVTRVRTPKNERVFLPNSNVLTTEVVNYSQIAREEGVVLHSTIGIGYDTPWRQVEAMLLEAAARTEGLKEDPPPFVLQTRLGDFAVHYEINAYTSEAQRMPALYSALHANIQDVFNEYGVQIMSPAYENDPQTLKVVPPEKWYEAPARQPES